MTRPRLALFDVDGTLVDSQDHITRAMALAFEGEGLAPLPRAVVLSIVGLSLPDAVARLRPDLGAAPLARVVAGYKSAYASLRGAGQDSPLYPGARECLDLLGAHPQVLLGVATGKSRRGLTHLLAAHALEQTFLTTQVADDHPSKPHPAMIEAAMAAVGVEAVDTVMIGDTVYDMEMARAAGVRALGVAWGYHGVDALLAAGAEAVATGFDQVPGLAREFWELDDE